MSGRKNIRKTKKKKERSPKTSFFYDAVSGKMTTKA